MKVQRPCAELRENGAAKRHLPFPFSAHLLDFKGTPSFIHGVIRKADVGVSLKIHYRKGMIKMLLKQQSDYFEEIYQIYQEAFPETEQRTKEGQRGILENPRYHLRVIRDQHQEKGPIRAFLGYWELESCIFLEHLATTAMCRGQGYGRLLIQECLNEGEEKKKPLFLEIEPVVASDPMTGRRESFYHRCGFATNHFFYEQMPLKEGDLPISLWIMSWPKAIGENEFLPFKKEIYKQVYGVNLVFK